MKTNCIVCGTEVDNWDEAYSETPNTVHPIGGTKFRTYGHYGSTVFDPMDASFLDIVIGCSCLRGCIEHTYKGVNEQLRQEMEDQEAEMNKLLDSMNFKGT